MMNDRQKVALYVSRINRAISKLDYIMDIRESFSASALDPEFENIGTWAQEIKIYLDETYSKEIASEIMKISNSGNLYKLLLSYQMPDKLRGSISLYMDSMKEIRAVIEHKAEQEKGEYFMLPDAIANKEAAGLLGRAISAGILDQNYQPCKQTSTAQLRFLAFAIGAILQLKHRWEPFETLWNITYLSVAYIPKTRSVDFEDIINLYPEVDFTGISKDPEIVQAVCYAPDQSIPVNDSCNDDPANIHFNSDEDDKYLTKIFIRLKDNKLIPGTTTIEQWLYMCTGKQNLRQHYKPIMWNRELRGLVIVIMELFDKSDPCRKWAITSNAFRIKKTDRYEVIKPDNLRRANSDIYIGDLPKKWENFYNDIFKG